MNRIFRIKSLWREHSVAIFPEGLAGEEIAGICVTELDTFAAGCISSFISNRGELDDRHTAILGLCYRDLSVVVANLKDGSREYFARLEELARLVLEALRN